MLMATKSSQQLSKRSRNNLQVRKQSYRRWTEVGAHCSLLCVARVGFEGTVADLYLTTKRNQIHEENKTLHELQINNNQVIIVNATQQISKGQESVLRSRVKDYSKKNDKPPADAEVR